jgi:hypothetical protein
VVAEQEMESIDGMAERASKSMSDPKVSEAMKGYHDLVVDGRRELYKVE